MRSVTFVLPASSHKRQLIRQISCNVFLRVYRDARRFINCRLLHLCLSVYHLSYRPTRVSHTTGRFSFSSLLIFRYTFCKLPINRVVTSVVLVACQFLSNVAGYNSANAEVEKCCAMIKLYNNLFKSSCDGTPLCIGLRYIGSGWQQTVVLLPKNACVPNCKRFILFHRSQCCCYERPKLWKTGLQINSVGTNFANFGVGGRRGEARRADSGGCGFWGGDSQPLPTN